VRKESALDCENKNIKKEKTKQKKKKKEEERTTAFTNSIV
jgi:hypothetical protein